MIDILYFYYYYIWHITFKNILFICFGILCISSRLYLLIYNNFVLEMVVLETIRPFAVTAMALDIWLVIARRVTNKAVTTVVNRDIWAVNAANVTSSRVSKPNLIITFFKFEARKNKDKHISRKIIIKSSCLIFFYQ